MDIHKLTKADLEALLLSYQMAIDANLICSVTDDDGQIVYANRKFCEVSKYSLAELIGKKHNIINSGFHPKEFFANMWKTIREGNVWRGEIKNRASDGTYYWVDTTIVPMVTNGKKQFLSLRMLINERKELERKQNEYTEILENMLAFTSHELRTPVCSMAGLTNMNPSVMSPAEYTEWMEYLKTTSRRIEYVTKELSDFIISKKEKNKPLQ